MNRALPTPHRTLIPSLFATIAFSAGALALPPDAPDPYGIVIKPIPEKTVVLTFDDSVASHATVAAPLLKKLGFGGSFFICDFDHFNTRKDWYMTWAQIKSLADDGFDVGNHTKGHGGGSMDAWLGLEAELAANNIPKPITLCWPVYQVNPRIYSDLIAHHYTFGRGGHERPYRPTFDHPFDVPSFTIHDRVSYESFVSDAQRATRGQVVVYTFHGVPEGEHPPVSLAPETFTRMMQYLKDNQYHVIALRDLAQYVDVAKAAKFLPFPNRLPWGGTTRDGNLLYVSIRKLPAERKVTLPGMTTRIARAWFTEDPKKQPLTVLKADTGIQTIVVPESPLVLAGEFPTVITAELQGGPVATILEFGFPGAVPATISGNEIHAAVPLAADLAKLAPIYDTGSSLVTGKPASGAANNFTTPQTYTITAPDGSTRRYVVTVTPTLGAVAVSNPSFETFGASAEEDYKMESNPSGAIWTFTKHNDQGELGIRDLLDQPSAPRPLDGTRHAVFMRGPGNGVSQPITFDQGNYTISLDAVKRNGYEKTAAPLNVTLDGVPVLTLSSSQITEKWATYASPVIPVTAGAHTLGIVLGEGDGMDLLDNVVIHWCPANGRGADTRPVPTAHNFVKLPESDGHWRQVKSYVEATPDPDYHQASEAAREAFRDLKFGVRIHWGVYSMLGVDASWPFLKMPNDQRQAYQHLYERFNPTGFDADEWMRFFKTNGLRVFAFTTKHHDGFSMFDTKTRVQRRVNWLAPGGPKIEDCDLAYDIMESPFKRDIVRELTDAARRQGIKIDLYFSHPDWYDADFRPFAEHPLHDRVSRTEHPEQWRHFVERHRQQLTELLTHYGKLDMICLDQYFDETAWPDLRETMKTLRKLQPDVMFRCRGIGNYGDYYTPEGFVPGAKENTAMPWMVIYPLAGIWSYQSNASLYKDGPWIVTNLVDAVAKGGNFMVGIGPDAHGRFHPKAVEAIEYAGAWLRVNGEAIFDTRPRDGTSWMEGNDLRYTRSKDNRTVYAISLKWPGQELRLRRVQPRAGSIVRLLGVDQPLPWRTDSTGGIVVSLPASLQDPAQRPCRQAYAFKFSL